jgi:glycosyltransferase involved in cell wall biosynthesis
MRKKKLKLLIFIDWFEPGFKAGGPIRSMVNFANHFDSIYDLYIVTGDRDLWDTEPYAGIQFNQWLKYGNSNVMYCSRGWLNFARVKSLHASVVPDWIYVNGMFSWSFSILPLLVAVFRNDPLPVMLAPRGMLNAAALQFKTMKKRAFLLAFKMAGIPRKVTFQATSEAEKNDIIREFGTDVKALMLPNLHSVQMPFVAVQDKHPGEVRVIFVGRIHPIKNVHVLLQAVRSVNARVELMIVGEIDNREYWNNCKADIEALPANVKLTIIHQLPHKEIEAKIQEHHLFVSPTQTENFGHAIFEALKCGRPVLISDRTPWRNLVSRKAGWDLPLGSVPAFTEVLEKVAEMDRDTLNMWCENAWQYSASFIEKTSNPHAYQSVFDEPFTTAAPASQYQ